MQCAVAVATIWEGFWVCMPVGMSPSMHSATEGLGGVSFSAAHTDSVHVSRDCHTNAAMGQCMNACSCVSSSWHTSHSCWALGPLWWEPTMCALCSTLVCTHVLQQSVASLLASAHTTLVTPTNYGQIMAEIHQVSCIATTSGSY